MLSYRSRENETFFSLVFFCLLFGRKENGEILKKNIQDGEFKWMFIRSFLFLLPSRLTHQTPKYILKQSPVYYVM